jgi:diguanylate cyclase (GGDEF)-like protein
LKPIEQELKVFEDRLRNAERMASTDSLTDLFNRREGEKRAEERIRAGRIFCLLVLDLNHFKWINDRYGHNCGDQVLKLVARKLEEQIRPSDTVCRWGGDEFLIIMECDLGVAMNRSRQIGEKLCGRYAVTISGRRSEVEVSACLGVAAHNPGETIEQVFERADAMLYQIKDKCRGGNLAQAFSLCVSPAEARVPVSGTRREPLVARAPVHPAGLPS